jgi:glycosyltransferase involved in cell wall biosynthesis
MAAGPSPLKVSLITASFNSAATIGDTLRSVARQTYPAIEHILIDGASRDETMAIVASEGGHLAHRLSEPDRGIYDAFNKGLDLAGGDIIGFINSDDFYCTNDVIAQVVDAFEDPEVEAVHADLVYVDPRDTRRIVRHWRSRELSERRLRRGFVPAHPTLFLRRSVYEKAGAFDLAYPLAADYEFMLRIFFKLGIVARHVPRIWVRMRAGGATGASLANIKKQNIEIRNAQRRHGIHYPRSRFLLFKLWDRTMQRLRAPLVRLPAEDGPA